MSEHEEAFLSCFFHDAARTQANTTDAGYNITTAMFTSDSNKRLYSTITELISKNIGVDVSNVKLKYKELYKSSADMNILMDLMNLSHSPAYADNYAGYILTAYKKKMLYDLFKNSIDILKKSDIPDTVLNDLIRDYENISGIITEKTSIKTQLDLASEYLEKEAELIELEASGLGKTGIKMIDENIFFDNGYTFFIGGRSGTGKTTLGYQLLQKYCEAYKIKGLFVSLEMPGVPLFRRSLVTQYSEKNLSRLSPDYMKNAIRNNRETLITEVLEKNKNILICDTPCLTLSDIERTINIAKRKYKNLGIICVDYIGYIKADGGKNITEQVAIIARGTKELAKKLNIRVMILSQLNREGGTDGTTPVSLHHFKDSGAIEESADIAIGMWKSSSDKNRIHCEILKNREGESGIKFDFIKYATFMQEADLVEDVEEKPVNRSKYQVTKVK
jgi:replicative DNA helicase